MRITPVMRNPLVLALSAIFIFILVAACVEEPLDNGFGAEPTPENGTPTPAVAQELEGTVENVDAAAGVLTLTTANGEAAVVGVDQSTFITVNGSTGTLTDIQAGDAVEVELDQSSNMAVAITVERSEDAAQAPQRGTVVDVDADTGLLVLTTADGETRVVGVDQSTVITVNGSAGTLADIRAGDAVEVELDPTTELAAQVTAESAEDAAGTVQQGTVESVDAGVGMLVLTSASGEPMVVGVNQDTVVTINGQAGVLSDIQPGHAVEVEVSEHTDMAISITVLSEGAITPAHRGTVESVDAEAGRMTVLLANGDTISVNVDQSTVININGSAATLADVEAGDAVEVELDQEANVATSVTLVGPESQGTTRQGTVQSVNAGTGTLVLVTTAGESLEVGVDQSTSITVNGSAGALADIQPGDSVQVEVQQGVDVAASVVAQSHQTTDEGEITAVNPLDQTITVETEDNRVLRLRFLVLDGSTEVVVDGGQGTILDLVQGTTVEVTYNPETMVVTTIHLKTNGS